MGSACSFLIPGLRAEQWIAYTMDSEVQTAL